MISILEIKKNIIIACIVLVFGVATVNVGSVYAQENEYFDLKPLYMPILTNKGVTEHVSLLVSVEIEEGDMEKLETYRSRLADAYIKDLYGAFSNGDAMIGDIVDVENIRHRLIAVTQDTLGDKYIVNDILLQVVQQGEL